MFTVPEKFQGNALWVDDAKLRSAARLGQVDEVEFLLRAGIPADGPADRDGLEYILHAGGRTALFHAFCAGGHRIANLLLDAGARADRQDETGETPLDAWYDMVRQRAADHQWLPVEDALLLDRLLSAGAHPDAPSAHGMSLRDRMEANHGPGWMEQQRVYCQAMEIERATVLARSPPAAPRL